MGQRGKREERVSCSKFSGLCVCDRSTLKAFQIVLILSRIGFFTCAVFAAELGWYFTATFTLRTRQ